MLNTPSELSNDDAEVEAIEDTTETEEESTEAIQEDEELEETEEDDSESEDDEEVFLVGDRKITKSEFEQMEKNQMLHSDYTRKRQAEAAQLKERLSDIDGVLEQAEALESFLDEDESAVDWDMLSNSESKELERKFAARRKKIQALRDSAGKQKRDIDSVTIEQTNKAVFDHFSHWQEKPKEADADRKLAYEYAKSIGYTDEALNKIDNPQAFISLIEAARAKKELESIKSAQPDKKLKRKAPKSIKGKKAPAKHRSWADVFYS